VALHWQAAVEDSEREIEVAPRAEQWAVRVPSRAAFGTLVALATYTCTFSASGLRLLRLARLPVAGHWYDASLPVSGSECTTGTASGTMPVHSESLPVEFGSSHWFTAIMPGRSNSKSGWHSGFHRSAVSASGSLKILKIRLSPRAPNHNSTQNSGYQR